MRQLTPFRLGDNLLGINVLVIREINRNLDITPVDRAPEYVAGLLNLRGQIITVLDLGVRLGLGTRPITSHSCCIVLKTNDELQQVVGIDPALDSTSSDSVGLLVDGVEDIITIQDAEIEPAPANVGELDGTFVSGVIKLDGNLVVVLNLSAVITVDR